MFIKLLTYLLWLVLRRSLRGEEGKEKGEGNGKRGTGREGKGGEGKLTLMRNWNRAADWLRPALVNNNCQIWRV